MTEPKRIDIKEFRSLGFLQEANRQFFHPLGLALEIVQEPCEICEGDGAPCPICGGDGHTVRLGGVWDYREDPEGIIYSDDQLSAEKARTVKAERDRHVGPRIALFKEVTQRIKDPLRRFWVTEMGMIAIDYLIEAESEQDAKKFVEDSDRDHLESFEEDRTYLEWEVQDNVSEESS